MTQQLDLLREVRPRHTIHCDAYGYSVERVRFHAHPDKAGTWVIDYVRGKDFHGKPCTITLPYPNMEFAQDVGIRRGELISIGRSENFHAINRGWTEKGVWSSKLS